jgi:hypothetical protein
LPVVTAVRAHRLLEFVVALVAVLLQVFLGLVTLAELRQTTQTELAARAVAV